MSGDNALTCTLPLARRERRVTRKSEAFRFQERFGHGDGSPLIEENDMPQFFFDVERPGSEPAEKSDDLPSLEHAKQHARRILNELTRNNPDLVDVAVSIRDEKGHVLYRVRLNEE